MKKSFKEYNIKNKEELESLWSNALITLDANVLLNSYRYSVNTREHLFKTLNSIKSKLFLTHQATLEFYKNRINEIYRQAKSYEDFVLEIQELEQKLNAKNRHPFISDKMHNRLNSTFKQLKKEVESSKMKYVELVGNDTIHERLDKIFMDKIDDGFDADKLAELLKEGEKRFERKVPPGYEDFRKDGDKQYGDLILWCQMKENAKTNKKPLILVSDDKKEDWWWKTQGKKIGPRPELIKEMQDECGVDFHMYTTERFLEYANEYLKNDKNTEALNEISSLRKIREEGKRRSEQVDPDFEVQKQLFEDKAKQMSLEYAANSNVDDAVKLHELMRKKMKLQYELFRIENDRSKYNDEEYLMREASLRRDLMLTSLEIYDLEERMSNN